MCVDLTVVVDLVVVTLRSRYKTVTRGSLRALGFFFVWMDFCWPLPLLELKQLRAFLCWLIFARQTAPDAQYERSAYSVCLWSSVDSVELICICAGGVANFHRKIWNIYFLTHKSTYTRMSL